MTFTDDESLRQADLESLRDMIDGMQDEEYATMLHYVSQHELTPELRAQGFTREVQQAIYGVGDDSILMQIAKMAAHSMEKTEHAQALSGIYVVSAALPTINGYTTRTPLRRTPTIVLNHGTVNYMSAAAHLALGLTTWTDGSYCNHYPAATKFDGLLQLGRGVVEKKFTGLREIEAAECLGKHNGSRMLLSLLQEDHEEKPKRRAEVLLEAVMQGALNPFSVIFENSCLMAELFIVIHEMAHIILGHLDNSGHPHDAELEADRFAFTHMLQLFSSGSGYQQRDIVYGIGILFMLTRAVELASPGSGDVSHPVAAKRWANVKAQMTEAFGPSAFHSIDHFFELTRK